MKRASLVLFATLCFSLSLWAKPKMSTDWDLSKLQLLSHAEFVKLDEKRQQAYIDGLKIAIFNFEKYMGPHLNADPQAAARFRVLKKFVGGLTGVEAMAAEATPGYRCIYAGFAIQGDVCAPQKQIPYVLKIPISYLGPDGPAQRQVKISLKCAAGTTLCNPIIFGVKVNLTAGNIQTEGPATDEKVAEKFSPYCVSSVDTRNTSRECYYAAQGNTNAKEIAKYNPERFDQFNEGWKELCNGDVTANKYFKGRPRAIQDLKDTCAWVTWQAKKAGVGTFTDTVPPAPPLPGERRQSYGPDRNFRQEDSRQNEPGRQ